MLKSMDLHEGKGIMLYQASYSKVVIPPKLHVREPSRIQTSTKKDSRKTNHGYSRPPNQRTKVIMETWHVRICSHDQTRDTDRMKSEIEGFYVLGINTSNRLITLEERR